MNDLDLDLDVRSTAQHVARLSHDVELNLEHKAKIHAQLMQRHMELSRQVAKRRRGGRLASLTRLRRLTLVAVPALAIASAFSIMLWVFQASGHSNPQAAEAARITQALVRTVPTVTSWQITVQQERGNAAVATQCPVPPGHWLYIRQDRSYLYDASDRAWHELAGDWRQLALADSTSGCPANFEWAFAMLPNGLAHHQYTFLPRRADSPLDGIRYVVAGSGGIRSRLTVWVSRESGLVVRLNRLVMNGTRAVERDSVTYRYETVQRTP